LPNPTAPQTDASDEYIELFNPNNQDLDLAGYTIQTGLKFAYSYSIMGLTMVSNSYTTFTSGNTKLTLANSGGQARLLDKNGQVVSQTIAYNMAPSGQAWALANGIWQWTTTPTPGVSNVITTPVKTTVATKASLAKPSSKPTPKPKVAVAQVKVQKPTKTKKPKAVKSASVSNTALAATDEANRPTPLHSAVLVGVSLIAVLYGAYEYRTDMGNKLYQFRRNREARRATRETTPGQ
jgi:hypothetical protein